MNYQEAYENLGNEIDKIVTDLCTKNDQNDQDREMIRKLVHLIPYECIKL